MSVYIKESGNQYIIFSNGKVINAITGMELQHCYKKAEDYFYVNLKLKGDPTTRCYKLINLVYTHFIGEIPPGMKVWYKNENDKRNVDYSNLYVKKLRDKSVYSETPVDYSKYGLPLKDFPHIYISKDGNCFSTMSMGYLSNYLNANGYYTVSISFNNKKRILYIHRLVYETYKGSLNEGLVIDHIDRNKLNNNVDNLRQVTISENSLNVERQQDDDIFLRYEQQDFDLDHPNEYTLEELIQDPLFGFESIANIRKCCRGVTKTSYGYQWRYKDDINYIENNFENDLSGYYKISTNDGRDYSSYAIRMDGSIINSKQRKMTPYNLGGYLKVRLKNNIGSNEYFIHRLVALTFLPNPQNLPIVNHIDENKLNNNVTNLEWCNESHNISHSRGVKICQYSNINFRIIRIFNSFAEVDRYLSKTNCADQIKNACKTGSMYYNSYWRFYKENDKIGDLLSI